METRDVQDRAVVALHNTLQREHVRLRAKHARETAALHALHALEMRTLWARRAALVGDVLPDFWRTALYAHSELCVLADVDRVHDHDALGFLRDVQADVLEPDAAGVHGFALAFVFAPNPFFANPVLHKSYWFAVSTDPTDPAPSRFLRSEGFAAAAAALCASQVAVEGITCLLVDGRVCVCGLLRQDRD